MDNDVIVKIPKLHLSTRTEFGNNDFQNQRTQASKNTYVSKNQTKMPVGVTFWFPVYPTIPAQECVNYRIIITHSNFCGKILSLYLPDGIPVEWRVSNQKFSVMNDIRYVIFTRGLLRHQ